MGWLWLLSCMTCPSSHFQLPKHVCMTATFFKNKHRTCSVLTLFFGKICQTCGTNCWSENLVWNQFQNTIFSLWTHTIPEHNFLFEENCVFWTQFQNTNFASIKIFFALLQQFCLLKNKNKILVSKTYTIIFGWSLVWESWGVGFLLLPICSYEVLTMFLWSSHHVPIKFPMGSQHLTQ